MSFRRYTPRRRIHCQDRFPRQSSRKRHCIHCLFWLRCTPFRDNRIGSRNKSHPCNNPLRIGHPTCTPSHSPEAPRPTFHLANQAAHCQHRLDGNHQYPRLPWRSFGLPHCHLLHQRRSHPSNCRLRRPRSSGSGPSTKTLFEVHAASFSCRRCRSCARLSPECVDCPSDRDSSFGA